MTILFQVSTYISIDVPLYLSFTARHKDLVGFWSNVYGFKMTSISKDVVREPSVEVVKSNTIITKPIVLKEFDLMTCSTKDVEFSTQFEMEVTRSELLTAFVGYFDIFFDLEHPVSFSTGPCCEPTHWKQTVFFLNDPVEVREGMKYVKSRGFGSILV